MGKKEIPFSEPTGNGRVILSTAGSRLRIGIDKEWHPGRFQLVHAALAAGDVRRVRDGLNEWLSLKDGGIEE